MHYSKELIASSSRLKKLFLEPLVYTDDHDIDEDHTKFQVFLFSHHMQTCLDFISIKIRLHPGEMAGNEIVMNRMHRVGNFARFCLEFVKQV